MSNPRIWNGLEQDIVTYLDHMGDDLAVVNAARVSFDKTSEVLSERDGGLINYLAKHNHWSPFSHCVVKMRFAAPIYIARQLQKHQVGFAWNEVSRRYVSSEPEFFVPLGLRRAAENVKQGSSTELIENNNAWRDGMIHEISRSVQLYNDLLNSGCCAEQARSVLPQSMMTEWIWTGSLYAWARMYSLRIDRHAQREVQLYAERVGAICEKLYPLSWEALVVT